MPEITAMEKLLGKAFGFLSFRPRSEFEIRNYLRQKVRKHPLKFKNSKFKTEVKAPVVELEVLIDEVISKLQDLDYINDGAFVFWWLEQRICFKPRGKFLLKSELFTKGIDRDLIESELAKYSLEDEVSWAKKVLDKKAPSYASLEPRERREKLSAHLTRRGFSWEVIGRVFAGGAWTIV